MPAIIERERYIEKRERERVRQREKYREAGSVIAILGHISLHCILWLCLCCVCFCVYAFVSVYVCVRLTYDLTVEEEGSLKGRRRKRTAADTTLNWKTF